MSELLMFLSPLIEPSWRMTCLLRSIWKTWKACIEACCMFACGNGQS